MATGKLQSANLDVRSLRGKKGIRQILLIINYYLNLGWVGLFLFSMLTAYWPMEQGSGEDRFHFNHLSHLFGARLVWIRFSGVDLQKSNYIRVFPNAYHQCLHK